MRGLKTWLTSPMPAWPLSVRAVGDDDARRFLPAVLLGEKSLVADLRRVGGAPDAEQAALFLLFVFFKNCLLKWFR